MIPPLAQSGGVPGGAIFTLLGVGITGFVTLVSVLVKHILDARVEKQRYLRKCESEQLDHERNLERLRIEADEKRSDALRRQQTEALARFLSATLSIYTKVQAARGEWRDHQHKDRYMKDLRTIDPGQAQIAFEEVRLISSLRVVDGATKLWYHLRGAAVAKGMAVDSKSVRAWQEIYWALRKDLISVFQSELPGSDADHSERIEVVQVEPIDLHVEQLTDRSNYTKEAGA